MHFEQRPNSKELLTAILQYSNDIIISLSNDYTINILNTRAEQFYNWKFDKIKGKNFLKLCNDFHYTSPISNHFFDNPSLLTINLDCKNAKDKICNINWIIYPLPAEEVVIIGKDVELKKNNIAYYLNGIIDAIPGCLYWKDSNGRYLGCNTLTAKLAGLSLPSEVVGKTDEELWGKQAEGMISNDKQVVSEGKTILVEEDLITAEGQWMYFTGVKMPLRDENNHIIGIIGNSLDITDKKKLEQSLFEAKERAEAANQAKIQFIANMSHDIRTPLTGVIGLSEILQNTLQKPAQKEDAKLLHDSGEELLNMLNDILDDVRAEHMNENDLYDENFDLYQCIGDLVRLELPTTKLKKLNFDVAIASNVPKYIVSDRKKIHRILLNLLGNAIKFTQVGTIKIELSCLHIDSSTVHLQFAVSDTGIGIPKALQSQVFERFFRATSSYQGLYKGHGLGLHIAQSYVSLLGGHIALTSEEGIGSTFYFDLQCKHSEEKKSANQPVATSSTISPTLKTSSTELEIPHLLLVEDNLIALKVLESIVSKAGFCFTSTSNGENALELAKTLPFNLIITDIGLPGILGNQFTRLLRDWEKNQHRPPVPILGLTGHVQESAHAECLAAGMNEVFTKPVNLAQLENMVKTFASPPRLGKSRNLINRDNGLGEGLPSTEEELFQLEQFSLLDLEEGIKTLGTLEVLKELISQWVKEGFSSDVSDLQEAHAKDDWDKIQQIAHKIKGGAVYVGTIKIKMACQYLERYGKLGKRDLMEALYQQVLTVIEASLQEIRAWLDKS